VLVKGGDVSIDSVASRYWQLGDKSRLGNTCHVCLCVMCVYVLCVMCCTVLCCIEVIT